MPWGEDWAFQLLVGDAVETSQVLIKLAVTYVASSFTPNMIKGINALRCMVAALGENFWNLIAAAYWAATAFG